MANRFCNLIGAEKIKDSYTDINVGFDGVQEELDGMKASGRSTFVIAPADATEKSKRQADVVLPGENDHVVINNIIVNDLINPTGQFGEWKHPVLRFTEGKIHVGGTIRLISGLCIYGAGSANTIFYLQNGAKCDVFGQVASEPTIYKNHLKGFLIEGNYENNNNNGAHDVQFCGINIIPQEIIIEDIFVYHCYRGIKIFGEGSYGGFVTKCMIQNNFNYGIGVAGDTIVTSCGIGGNGKHPAAEWVFGSCGAFMGGWNSQMIANHFADNLVDIFSNWCNYNQYVGNVFEAGIKENFVFEGRAWANQIISNRFGGRHVATGNNNHDGIAFRYISAEGAYGNMITNNSFSVHDPAETGYKYCVSESANCNYNMISSNVFLNGYRESSPVLIVGAHTSLGNNM